jgi:phosphomevalonate kinase
VEAVADTMIEAGIHPPNGRWFVDSRALSNDIKLGLGSSGAVAAGLVAAWAPHVAPEAALHLALDAHHRFQGRIGSGSDVIASAHGGLVRVQRGQPPQALAVPNELEHATIAVGAPADTRDMVRRMRAWRSAAPRVAAPLFDDLATAAAAGVYALSSMDIDGWLDAVRRYEACERALTRASGVPIITPAIEGAIQAAANAGWVAKPSGAGGGDVVVAFSRRGDRDRLEEAVRSVGLSSISLALSPGGVLFAPLDRTSRT